MGAIADLIGRKNDVASQLARLDVQLEKKRSALAGEVLAGGDAAKLSGEIAALEAKRDALSQAASLAGKLEAESKQESDLQAAQEELAAIDDKLHGAALDVIKRLYALYDELMECQRFHARARALMAHYPELRAKHLSQSFGVLALVLRNVNGIRRAIEVNVPNYVSDAGMERRF